MNPKQVSGGRSVIEQRRAHDGFPPGIRGSAIAISGNLLFGGATGLVLGPLLQGKFGLAFDCAMPFIFVGMILGKPTPFLRYSVIAPALFVAALMPALFYSLSLRP